MSEIRDAWAKLLGKLSVERLVIARGISRTGTEARDAWLVIDQLEEKLTAELEHFEPLLAVSEEYLALAESWPGDERATAVAKRLLEALDDLFDKVRPAIPPAPVAGFARAGEAQLPLGDRTDPPENPGNNPPP